MENMEKYFLSVTTPTRSKEIFLVGDNTNKKQGEHGDNINKKQGEHGDNINKKQGKHGDNTNKKQEIMENMEFLI